MTAPAKNEHALATREQIAAEQARNSMSVVPPHVQMALDERKTRNAVAAQIAAMTWGKDLDRDTQRAVSEWCHRNDVDPTTELEILGGKVYRTAYWYRRKVSALHAAGIVTEIFAPDHIAADPRLDAIAKAGGDDAAWAKQESARRLRLRIEHGVPENAAGAVVQRFRVAGLDAVVVGCNWCGGGTGKKKRDGSPGDPVGDANPTLTAETRAYRRAALKIADAMPTLRQALGVNSSDVDGGFALEEAITESRARVRASIAEHEAVLPSRGTALASIDDDYSGMRDEHTAGADATSDGENGVRAGADEADTPSAARSARAFDPDPVREAATQQREIEGRAAQPKGRKGAHEMGQLPFDEEIAKPRHRDALAEG